ncbi:MAG TPA: hypothetical protein VM325_05455 [Alphaproteobacteria bacterium]|nr:hypothetical protein [Alphaproteobacteria bacterium]
MSGALHQLKLDYFAAEDRLVLRISTHDKTEVRLWLTRRFTKALWQGLIKVVEANPSALHATDPQSRESVIAFQHEQAVDEEQFGHTFEETATVFPLGETPSLIVGLTIGSPEPGDPPRLVFETAEKRLISLGLDEQILHSLMHLLALAMKQTDWDIILDFTVTAASEAMPERRAQLH